MATVVFDLDGTLLDGDSTSFWLWEMVRGSRRRSVTIAALAPVAAALILIPRFRRLGASLLTWVATAGLTEAQLISSFERFALRLKDGHLRLQWRGLGLSTLEEHLSRGERVVIVTGAPVDLARALFRTLDKDIHILGSSLKVVGGGWVAERHCRHQEKCRMLDEAGYGERWAFAYTDSADDLPLLLGAEQPRLINAHPLVRRRLRWTRLRALETLEW
jgi:phosphatidylglycerophosphatase C